MWFLKSDSISLSSVCKLAHPIPAFTMTSTEPNDENRAAKQHAVDIIEKEIPKKWTGYIWDTFDKSPEERKYLFKLDAAILTFASLGYFIKYLDQANVNNAFVSGMKEDLNLYGNQLNYMQSLWTVGYVLGENSQQYCLDSNQAVHLDSNNGGYLGSLDICNLESKLCSSIVRSEILRGTGGKHVLSWHAIYHWVMVSKR